MSRLFGIPVDSLAVVLVVLMTGALGVVAALALRNRVFLRLGIRNAGRRRGRSALIVLGLMLGTAIIAAALATGDTMSHTIRSSAVKALGPTDEVVAAKGLDAMLASRAAGTGARYFPERYASRIAQAGKASGLVSGVEPVIIESVAVQDVTTRQNEPAVTLFARGAASRRVFGEITTGGQAVSLVDLRPHEIYLNEKAAHELRARTGDTIRILAGQRRETARVRAVVSYEGGATDASGLLMPLDRAQRLLGTPGRVRAIFVANKGGVGATDRVVEALTPVAAPLGLEVDNSKQDALDQADKAGAAFLSMFTTFGSFSIAAGVLLIFLIFVMLASERRGELGIARAVGTRRGHLVQMFLYEGAAYDLVAAAVGALLGVAVAYGMVRVMAGAFSSAMDFHIAYSVKLASVALAYAIGVLLTLAVVAFSARRVSRMNIVAAIRDLPEPLGGRDHRRRRWLLGLAGIALGVLFAVAGVHAQDQVPLGLGISLIVLGLVPIARALGAVDRAVYTAAGLALVAWFALPVSRWLFGELKVNFSIFVLGGLMIVIGATWTIMYNADVLLGALSRSLGRVPGLAPVLKMSVAYPLRGLFRTGVTLAMFTLVVFTLVTGAITTGSFVNGFNDVRRFGGGFDVRATTSAASPIRDMRAALARARGIDAASVRLVSDQSVLPVKARQVGYSAKPESYLIHGVDNVFLRHTTYELGAMARGYTTPAAVWRAIRTHPRLAVIDSMVVPRKANWNMGPTSPFRLHGFYLEDKTFAPIRVDVRDPQTGRHERLTVIGVLADTVPQFMSGLWTSQATLSRTFGDRVLPTTHLFSVASGVDPSATASKLEADFLANGMQADSLQKLLDDAVSASLTFDRLIMGFMGLGLVVGVAALGVITARSVVERRQQIGVLRSIGFRRRMVQLAFVLESSFVALTAIIVGTALGVLVGFNVVHDASRQPGMESVGLTVPWASLGVIFAIVYLVALATTWLPAVRASRIYPAEALRYQ